MIVGRVMQNRVACCGAAIVGLSLAGIALVVALRRGDGLLSRSPVNVPATVGHGSLDCAELVSQVRRAAEDGMSTADRAKRTIERHRDALVADQNAHWLGQLLALARDFDGAARAFGRHARLFPGTDLGRESGVWEAVYTYNVYRDRGLLDTMVSRIDMPIALADYVRAFRARVWSETVRGALVGRRLPEIPGARMIRRALRSTVAGPDSPSALMYLPLSDCDSIVMGSAVSRLLRMKESSLNVTVVTDESESICGEMVDRGVASISHIPGPKPVLTSRERQAIAVDRLITLCEIRFSVTLVKRIDVLEVLGTDRPLLLIAGRQGVVLATAEVLNGDVADLDSIVRSVTDVGR